MKRKSKRKMIEEIYWILMWSLHKKSINELGMENMTKKRTNKKNKR